ncbi:TetR family transcriptional regulator [Nocardia sp. CY41]|uniref:TetR family transcriptional regulator n=1 Tax=Nocardia sp. CY41 TaxID=2608686 RepID=UPI001916659C|nr:TetR family transcriptional regulator [Nocardia sp. CY41]
MTTLSRLAAGPFGRCSAPDKGGVPNLGRAHDHSRNALPAAARKFLSEGRSAASIQEITDAADAGFGSFYNHFQTVSSALEVYAQMRDEIVRLYDDPAEVFAVRFRMTGRLQR